MILVAGFYITYLVAKSSDRAKRQKLESAANLYASALPDYLVEKLAGDAGDLQRKSYRALRESLVRGARADPEIRFLYIMKINETANQLVIAAHNVEERSDDYVEPGTVYFDAPVIVGRILAGERHSGVVGPWEDRWGTYVSAFVPLFTRDSEVPAGVLGMDVSVENWYLAILRECALPILLTFLACSVLFWNRLLSKNVGIRTKKLAETERELQALFDHTFQFMGTLSPDGRLRKVNKTALDFIEVDEDLVINKYFWETPWWEGQPALQESLKKAIAKCADDEFHRFEAHHTNASGETIIVDFSLNPVKNELDEVVLLIAEGRNITGQRKIEEQLRQSEKMRAVGLLAGGVAHDFNNMLSAIVGSAELLRAKADSELSRYIDIIATAAGNAARLTSKLLAFSQKEQFVLKPLDLHELLFSTLDLLQKSVGSKTEITFSIQATQPVIWGDTIELQNCLINLCANADHAMADGGRIVITTKDRELDQTYCRKSNFTLCPGPYLELRVEDNGRGIEPQHLENIFEPFFTTKKSGSGTGLGLPTVYGSVLGHNGAITVASKPGEGTAFSIMLPVTDMPIDEITELSTDLRLDASILVVEDEEFIREILGEILTDFGVKVSFAINGTEAVEYYLDSENRFDLVLVDFFMPGLNGRETMEQLLAIDPDARVVIMSGYTRDEDVSGLLERGARDFMRKPFQKSDLTRILLKHLQ